MDKFHEFSNEYGKDKEYYLQGLGIDLYPGISYILLNTFIYSPEEIEEIKSLGGKIINKYDRHVFSVDPEGGVVTEMKVYSDEYFSYYLSYSSALAFGKVKADLTEADREHYKKAFYEKRDNGPIEFERYLIDSYAGGLLKAKHEKNIIGR